MKRQEKRRTERMKAKEVTLNLKSSQIMALQNEASANAVLTMKIFFAMALNREFGFGTERINRVIKNAMHQINYLNNGYIDGKDAEQWAKEYGIKLD